ncbi:adenylate/guanylate cyclase domain-containing protein [Alteromonas lipolytica]|uniref:Cyclase n=1 Tax=Alteromonas lipolytica TaxID=1856405 RepID=A0A1E8FBC8_9ALTE|nr:adenylate/guanylate cyclase domain-containing protein [Alteromonas lipolytica]OFI33215.1 cyclase [Alteromonas lipolytica]GGF61557.1 hypothetical protein GCM10011338_12320 [Alteromonas lipolytica]
MTIALAILLAALVLYGGIVTLMLLRQRRKMLRIARAASRVIPETVIRNDDSEQRFLEKADEAMRLNQTFQKFVPRQFVDHFAKHGLDTLELGRADEDEVAILFCDIRGFTGLSEKMKPQELMNFLNSYFLRMNDPIHQNGGFIDKFIGDAIMALFDHPGGAGPDKANDAVNAALDLQEALNIYNHHRANCGYEGIKVGVGVHFGPVILGTVGSDDRMDTTVIGDSVNIAFRLEGLAPKYNADIVISAQTLKAVSQKQKIDCRVLDLVRVKGRQAPIRIYEVLNHLDDKTRKQKLAVAPYIRDGLACRMTRDWDEALGHFNTARLISPDDSLIQHHIQICKTMMHSDLPPDWDGAVAH